MENTAHALPETSETPFSSVSYVRHYVTAIINIYSY